MKTKIFKGVATALVTPMKPDGSISYDTLSGLIDYQLKHHADAVVIGGTTGESASLSEKELLELTAFAVKAVRGHVPVIANMGSNNTAHSAELAGKMEKLGADALLSVTPYYNKASQQGLYEHFKAGAAATGLPIILYNVPPALGSISLWIPISVCLRSTILQRLRRPVAISARWRRLPPNAVMR